MKHYRLDKGFRGRGDDNKMFTSRSQDKTEIRVFTRIGCTAEPAVLTEPGSGPFSLGPFWKRRKIRGCYAPYPKY